MKKPKLKATRRYHPWWDWECFKAGFYNTSPPEGLDADEAQLLYWEFLQNLDRFGKAMARVMQEWPVSCEHFLTNTSLNRIAWLGQASMCIETGISSEFKGGFKLLTQTEQDAADALAQQYLDMWLEERCRLQKESVNT